MHVVVIDSNKLAGEVDFPMIEMDKFGWQQFTQLEATEIADRCWRSDVIISVDTPVTREVIDKAFKLQLIIAAGDNAAHIDMEAARLRGIVVCNTPGLDPGDKAQSQNVCDQVINNINAWLKKQPVNMIT
jgi:glycerate dehydrogenase